MSAAAHDLRPTGASAGASWERAVGARRRVMSLLCDLPPGFVVFHDIELPRPTRSLVQHLVVGPRNVWAVTTHVVDEPVVHGRGRNADTLFAGRSSLRPWLEAADWEATALGELLGHPVEPVVVLVAPALPASTFDLNGIRICEPRTLMRQVATSTADYVDVGAVLAAAERALGVRAEGTDGIPRLGSPTLPPTFRPTKPARHRRTLGARAHAVRSSSAARAGALVLVAALVIAALPTIRSLWGAVASEGSEVVADAFSGEPSQDASATDAVEPASVGIVWTCRRQGQGGWDLNWRWPGTPVEGAVGYHIATRTGDGPRVRHTVGPWTDPSTPPPTIRVVGDVETVVSTHHVTAGGSVVATTEAAVEPPSTSC